VKKGRMVRMAVGLYGGMVAAGIAWGVSRGLTDGWWQFASTRSMGEAVIAGTTLGLVAILLSWELERGVPGVQELSDRFSRLLAGTTTGEALLLAGLSAVGEELLFRGCLQEEIGLWWATLLFAVVHSGRERMYLWWTASAFVFGLGLGAMYESQGGLLAPIVMHFVINAVNIRMLGIRGEKLVRRRGSSLGTLIWDAKEGDQR
jgi:uncharacterized protein